MHEKTTCRFNLLNMDVLSVQTQTANPSALSAGQGELELVVHLVAEDERDEEAWKCMSGHVKDAVDKKSGVGQICAEIWQYKDIPNAGIFAEVSLLAVVV